VPGDAAVFVIGDTAAFDQDGKPLPGVAQVALQQGGYVAAVIAGRVQGRPALSPFAYRNLGNLAIVGRGFALLDSGRRRMAGHTAWIIWALVHIAQLAAFMNRLRVMVQWGWAYFTRQHGSRLILEPRPSAGPGKPARPSPPGVAESPVVDSGTEFQDASGSAMIFGKEQT
jgi:NADH dehydrogenase